jgi:thioredoxin 1
MKDFMANEVDSVVLSSKSLLLFYADWCGYCKSFIPAFAQSIEKLDSEIIAGGVKLNDDDNPLWDKFKINAVPTMIAFSKGSVLDRKDAKMGIGLAKRDLVSILSSLGHIA